MRNRLWAGLVVALSVLFLPFGQQGEALADGKVTFVFDDGYASDYSKALPIFNSYGFTATVAIITSTLGSGNPSFGNVPCLSVDQIKSLQDSGWEIASHGVNHVNPWGIPLTYGQEILTAWTKISGYNYVYGRSNPYDTVGSVLQNGAALAQAQSVSAADQTPGSYYFDASRNYIYVHPAGNIDPNNAEMRTASEQYELERSKQALQQQGFSVNSFIAPFNEWGPGFMTLASPTYTAVAAGGATSNNPSNMMPLWLQRYAIGADMPPAYVENIIQTEAITNGNWVILNLHGIEDGSYMAWSSSSLSALLSWIKSRGVSVVTMYEGVTGQQPPTKTPAFSLVAPDTTAVAPGATLGPTNLRVGTSAVPGVYKYTVTVSDSNGGKVDEESFNFSVTQ